MKEENRTLGELLSDPRIRPIAPDAIRNRDLSREELWNKTPAQLKEEHFFSADIGAGFRRLFAAAETGEWYYPLENEAEDAGREGGSLVWLPSEEAGADGRPFILLVPGGGFVNVWNLTEGWPVAAQFNRLGYHVFILTYPVDDSKGLLERDLAFFARGLRLIREYAERFHVRADRYIPCGFSAGGYLVCLWNTRKGYPAFGMPKPEGVFPIYPVTSLKEEIRYGEPDPEWSERLYGCPIEQAAKTEYEIPEHVECFPPCALFLAADDELVDPENSKMLARALEARGIPCRMEIGPEGGHGFSDGTGMCMEGWTERAVRWFESLDRKEQ